MVNGSVAFPCNRPAPAGNRSARFAVCSRDRHHAIA